MIDASGTWGSPNWSGLGAERARYASKRIAVAGSGHSALTSLVALGELAEQEPGNEGRVLLRRGADGNAFEGA